MLTPGRVGLDLVQRGTEGGSSVEEGPDVAFAFGQDQGPFQPIAGPGRVTRGLRGQGQLDQNFEAGADAAPRLRRRQQAIQQSCCLLR